jgi:hypothetical protein
MPAKKKTTRKTARRKIAPKAKLSKSTTSSAATNGKKVLVTEARKQLSEARKAEKEAESAVRKAIFNVKQTDDLVVEGKAYRGAVSEHMKAAKNRYKAQSNLNKLLQMP